MGKVFISYDRSDEAYVSELALYLRRPGLDTWYDKDIHSGEYWHTIIEKELTEASRVVVVMTPEAKQSDWVNREITLAERLGKPIHPLLLLGEPFFRLINIQFIDVRGGRMPDHSFAAEIGANASVKTETADGSRAQAGLRGAAAAAALNDWLLNLPAAPIAELAWNVLGIVFAAEGPISVADVSDALGVPGRQVIEAIAPVRDLLLNRGRLSLHERPLRETVATQLGSTERRVATQRLHDWCLPWLDPAQAEGDIPEYVVTYGGLHLKAARATELVPGLIDLRWLRASVARTGSPAAFVRDMGIALELVSAPQPVDRRQLLRATAAAGGAAQLASEVKPEALGVIAATDPRRALDLASFGASSSQVESYGRISVTLHRQGDIDARDDAVTRGIDAASAWAGSDGHLFGFQILAEILDETSEAEVTLRPLRAVVEAHSVTSSQLPRVNYYAVVALFLKYGRLDEALTVAQNIGEADVRDHNLESVAVALARAGRALPAATALQSFVDPIGRQNKAYDVFGPIAETSPLHETLAAIDILTEPIDRDNARSAVAQTLARTGRPDAALSVARAVADDWRRGHCRVPVAAGFLNIDDVSHATEVLASVELADDRRRGEDNAWRDLDEDRWRDSDLAEAVERVAAWGNTEAALRAVDVISGALYRVDAVAAIAEKMAASGEVAFAIALAQRLEESAKDSVLAKTVQRMVKAGMTLPATEVADAISGASPRASSRLVIATALVRSGDHARAAALAENAAVPDAQPRTQVAALTLLARMHLLLGHSSTALPITARALEMAEANKDGVIDALATWAGALAETGRADEAETAARRALDLAAATTEDWRRDDVLGDLAEMLAEVGPPQAAIEAAAIPRHVDEDRLAAIAGHLAERGLIDAAQAAMMRVTDDGWRRGKALGRVAPVLARRGQVADMLRIARVALHDPQYESVSDYKLQELVKSVVGTLLTEGALDRALDVARAVEAPLRDELITRIAQTAAQAGYLRRVATLATMVALPHARAGLLATAAAALVARGDLTNATPLADQSVALDRVRSEWSGPASELAELAGLALAAGVADSGIALADLAVRRAGAETPPDVNALAAVSLAYSAAGLPDRAAAVAEQSAAAAETLLTHAGRGDERAMAAVALAQADRHAQAISAARRALETAAEARKRWYRGQVSAPSVVALAVLALAQAGALDEVRAALAAQGEDAGGVLAQVAGLARADRRHPIAWLVADSDLIAVLPEGSAEAYVNLAHAALERGDTGAVATFVDRASALISGMTEPTERARILPSWALLLARLGRVAEAKAVRQATALLRESSADTTASLMTMILCETLAELGRTEEAVAAATDRATRPTCLVAIATVLFRHGDPQRAIQLVSEAVGCIWAAGETWWESLSSILGRLKGEPGLLRAWLDSEGLQRLPADLGEIADWYYQR